MSAAPPSIPPVTGGGLGHPGHFSGQGYPTALAVVGPRLVAPGYTYPGWHGVVWTSDDRLTWRLTELPGAAADAFPLAIAADEAGTGGATAGGGAVAVVGRRGAQGAAWLSRDGAASWSEARGDGFDREPETRLTSVIATDGGFVAAGWSGLFTQPATGRIWRSPDGARWEPVGDDDDRSFVDGRIAALARGPAGIVAVGSTGSLGAPTGAAAWVSVDGLSWQRAPAGPDLAAGAMRAVAGGPAGGFVAVGTSLAGDAALAWTSDDGLAWTLAPAQESLTFHGLQIVMDGVTAGPDGFVAVGHFLFGTQYGQGTAWTSPDGRTWTRADDDIAAFGQGEPAAVVASGGGYVAAGTVGAPDNAIPTVWLSPAE